MTIQRPLALLEMRLGQFDVEIERAFFGEQGYRLAVQDEFDLVISDDAMPHGDRAFFVETLRQNEKTSHVPVIMLTGQNLSEVRLADRLLGIDAYVQKPFQPDELTQTVSSLLGLSYQVH